jgi:ABC-type multidrug transport system fused ATPase/permease subunit
MFLQKKIKIIFTKSEVRSLVLILLWILIAAMLEVVGVASIAPFMLVISSPEMIHDNIYLSTLYQALDVYSNDEFIVLLGVIVIVMLFISNGVQAFVTWKVIDFSQNMQHKLRVRLLQKYLYQPYGFFLDRNTSELGKNIVNEVDSAVSGVIMQSLLIISKSAVVIFIFGLVLFVDPLTAIFTTVVLGAFYWIVFKLVKDRLHAIGTARTLATSQIFKISNEAMSGIKEIKLHNGEDEFTNRFSSPSKNQASYSIQSTTIAGLPRYLLEVVTFSGIIAIAVLSTTIGNIDSSKVIPMLSLYAMAGYRLMPALQGIYSGLAVLKYNIPVFNILVNDFSQETLKTKVDRQLPVTFTNKLLLKDVSFSYKNSKYMAIKKVNIEIPHNATIGLVGLTGSGKTTLIDILLGLLIPKDGCIVVDGIQINKNNVSGWQKNLGYVPQSVYLTDDTIESNIAFSVAKKEIDKKQVIEAAKMANLDQFILTLPKKYETIIGERGVRLSGGQCQRIGIARALYNNPSVLVLDEATSALDNITESIVMGAINNLSHRKTIIMIAHRLSTVKECDIIYMMDGGKIIDSGTYQQLISCNIDFQNMSGLS